MTKRVATFVGVLVVGIAMLYGASRDDLPPRTAEKVARVVSGLDVPNGSEVLVFEDEWKSFNGDGSTLIVLGLSNSTFDQLVAEALQSGFVSISTVGDLPSRVAAQLRGPGSRLLFTEGDIANGKTIVLDRETGRVVVYQVVS